MEAEQAKRRLVDLKKNLESRSKGEIKDRHGSEVNERKKKFKKIIRDKRSNKLICPSSINLMNFGIIR